MSRLARPDRLGRRLAAHGSRSTVRSSSREAYASSTKEKTEMTDRRSFLKSAGAASLMAGPWLKSTSPAASPNDTVNVAVVGIRSRGAAHYKQFAKLPNVNVVTLCDVDERLFTKALNDLGGERKIKTETDLRRVLDDKSVDAVSIATPDHWHALATIWACQAGKDVYVEKPASYNIFEGQQMVKAARKYNRMVQVGMQSRSIGYKRRAIELLRDGAIGKVYYAKGLCFKRRPSIGHAADEPVPAGINWDIFLGPAPMRAFNQLRFKY